METAAVGALRVTRLAFGCAPLGGLFEPVSDDAAQQALDAAWEAGIRTFDTAPLYGLGVSERRLGAALARWPREEITLCTKVGRVLEPRTGPASESARQFAGAPRLEPRFDFSRDGVLRSFEASLERLGVERLDVVHIHDPDDHMEAALSEA